MLYVSIVKVVCKKNKNIEKFDKCVNAHCSIDGALIYTLHIHNHITHHSYVSHIHGQWIQLQHCYFSNFGMFKYYVKIRLGNAKIIVSV